jgi:hypothetical protein
MPLLFSLRRPDRYCFHHERNKEGYVMTEAEANAMVGKRARILDSKLGVSKGTTGTVISARRAFADGQHMATGVGGKTPEPTATEWMWMNNFECDDPLKTTIEIYEWDDSIEEI